MSMAGIGKLLNNINTLPEEAKVKAQATVKAIQQAADRTGVDFAYLMQKANIESSLNPQAKASTSSATGLYQFVQNTWLDVVDRHGSEYGLSGAANAIQRDANGKPFVADKAARAQILDMRNNPQVAAVMAAELAAENTEALQTKVGGKIGATEMYLAHFLGANGAAELLNAKNANPNAPAARLLPDAANANHNVFFTEGGRARTIAEVYDNFAKKFSDVGVANAAPQVKPTAVAEMPVVDPVQNVADIQYKAKLQILATITPETNVADTASYIPMRVATNAIPTSSLLNTMPNVNGLLQDSAQFNAMLMAQQMLASTTHLSQRDSNKSA